MVGRGSCTSAVSAIIEETRGARGAGRLKSVRAGLQRSAIAAMCAGVVPQQPPTIERP